MKSRSVGVLTFNWGDQIVAINPRNEHFPYLKVQIELKNK